MSNINWLDELNPAQREAVEYIDGPSPQENLIACHYTVPEIAAMIGADSLGYLPTERLAELAHGNGYCSACFDGRYPTAVPADTRKDRFERKLSEIGK